MHQIIQTYQTITRCSHTIQRFTSYAEILHQNNSNSKGFVAGNFFLLKANEMIKVHTITSIHYITLEGTSHLRNINDVNYHITTQFQVRVTSVVAKSEVCRNDYYNTTQHPHVLLDIK